MWFKKKKDDKDTYGSKDYKGTNCDEEMMKDALEYLDNISRAEKII